MSPSSSFGLALISSWLTAFRFTPCLNEKIDSGKSHLQDLAQWWRTSQGVDIPKISQFYWGLFEKTRFLCFYIIKSSKKRAKVPLNLAPDLRNLKKYPKKTLHSIANCSFLSDPGPIIVYACHWQKIADLLSNLASWPQKSPKIAQKMGHLIAIFSWYVTR